MGLIIFIMQASALKCWNQYYWLEKEEDEMQGGKKKKFKKVEISILNVYISLGDHFKLFSQPFYGYCSSNYLFPRTEC